MRKQRTHFLVLALLGLFSAPLLLGATAGRTYVVHDDTSVDQSMSDGVPSVSCGANTGIAVKCSTSTTWTKFQGGNRTLSCTETDPGIRYASRGDEENWDSASWMSGCDGTLNVHIMGTVSNCSDSSLTYRHSCTTASQ